jgi:hypothetical protein
MGSHYEEILAGTVSIGYADCTLIEYARAIKYFVDAESRKIDCDTHLIDLLRRAACMGWENLRYFVNADKTAIERAKRDAQAEALALVQFIQKEVFSSHAEMHQRHCEAGVIDARKKVAEFLERNQ